MPRVGHAVAVAGSSMFMYGGTVGEGRASDHLDDFRTVLWELKVRLTRLQPHDCLGGWTAPMNRY
jgi:hypothetical protein